MAATVLATDVALELNPAIAEAIRESGFDVCSHGYRWVRAQRFTAEQEAEEIRVYPACAAVTWGCGGGVL